MNIQNIILVGIGGMMGSIGRYTIGLWASNVVSKPLGTFTVNIIGSIVLGVVYAFSLKRAGTSDMLMLLIGVGFCGGFTTFSAFAIENMQFLLEKNVSGAIMYMLASLAFGLAAVWGGFFLARALL